MQLQLQQLRKKVGYASRASFAKAFGEAERRIKAWERGENKLSLEDACRLADFLHCSLDELAGRWEYVGRYADARQRRLNSDYQALDEASKDAAVAAVSGMAAASKQGQGDEEEPEASARRVG